MFSKGGHTPAKNLAPTSLIVICKYAIDRWYENQIPGKCQGHGKFCTY